MTEQNFTDQPVNKTRVKMSGQMRVCPVCGRVGMLRRSVEKMVWIHMGDVKIEAGAVKVNSSSDYCKIGV